MKVVSFLISWFLLYSLPVMGYNASDPIWQSDFKDHNYEIVAFYHIQAELGTNYHSMVEQQLDILDNSGLFDKLEKIMFTTSGDKGKFFRIQNDKFHFLTYLGLDGEEFETLGLVQHYCRNHEKSKVLYFHNKHEGNSEFRSVLDCFVLNPNCISALDTYDTCGWRLSPSPFIHYAGNFWWAQCRHINKLVDPLSIATNQTFIEGSQRISECVGTRETNFADAWLGSLPKMNPSDCMSASIDTTYLTGGHVPSAAHAHCPDNDGGYGSTCDFAAAVKHPDAFTSAFNSHKMNHGKGECQRDLDAANIQRTQLWYGQQAEFYQDWLSKIKNLPKFKDGDAVRPARSKQVYYYKDECLHPIPNAGVFYSLGLSFDNVIVIYDHQLDSYRICGSM